MGKQPEASSYRVVNFSELFQRAVKDRELLQELLGIFKEDFPRYYTSLKEAVVRDDVKQVELIAHTLRGMLSNLAAARAAAATGRLENAARGGDQAGLMEGFALFEKEVSGLMPELGTYLEEARR
jgi:two-component system, sensor histidine kinase and response regulator